MVSRNAIVCGVLGLVILGCGSSTSDGTGGPATMAQGGTLGGGGALTGMSGAGATGVAGSIMGGGGVINAAGAGVGGSGGVTPTAGTGGAAPTAGTAGTVGVSGAGGVGEMGGAGGTTAGAGGMSGAGGGDGVVRGPSAGCNVLPPADETFGETTLKMIDVTDMDPMYAAGYTHRKYCARMPSTYDGTTPLPVVFYGPGCGATGCEGSSFSNRDDILYIQAIASADAHDGNEVPPGAAPGCFAAGKVGTADNPEAHYFDAVMAEVAATYCVDTSKVFAAGTSSGSWLSNYLGCARGGAVRGIAADSGGLQFDHGTCTGGAAIMEMPGDAANVTQDGHEIGQAAARDMFIELNGCSTTPTQMQFGDDNCDFYGGCASPVVWCDVGGGHQSGNGHLSPTGWAFWSTLQ